jgi:hypothetical protein
MPPSLRFASDAFACSALELRRRKASAASAEFTNELSYQYTSMRSLVLSVGRIGAEERRNMRQGEPEACWKARCMVCDERLESTTDDREQVPVVAQLQKNAGECFANPFLSIASGPSLSWQDCLAVHEGDMTAKWGFNRERGCLISQPLPHESALALPLSFGSIELSECHRRSRPFRFPLVNPCPSFVARLLPLSTLPLQGWCHVCRSNENGYVGAFR